MNFQDKRLVIIMLTVVMLLLIPFVAMQFSNEVDWSPFDFVVAGILLTGTGLAIELVLRKVQSTTHRIIICLALFAALFLVWAELAVGIFGTPLAGS